MKIGDIVWRSNSGAPYLVYFYKENNQWQR